MTAVEVLRRHMTAVEVLRRHIETLAKSGYSNPELEGVVAELEQTVRWRWALEQVAHYMPPRVEAVRHYNPGSWLEVLEHLAWLTGDGSKYATGDPKRWACWAMGAAVALGRMRLDDCARLCRRETWERAKASAEEST